MNSILIQNGQIFDPHIGKFHDDSIAVENGKIVEPGRINNPDIILNAAGCIVTPGLIDSHLHINENGSDGGVPVDLACLPNGVTTAVDGGSCGESNYRVFHNYHVVPAKTRVKSALNISSAGLVTTQFPENLNPALFARDRIKALFSEYPDELVSLKIRMSRGLVPDGDATPLLETLKLADEIGCNVVVHITNPAVDCETLAGILRPGDIFCHCFQGTGDTIINANNRIKPGIQKARERGVLFDACHGMVNFDNDVATAAVSQGFWPDIISTDFSPKTLYSPPVVSLPRLVSKFVALGMSLKEALKRVTLAPAEMVGISSELGDLSPGSIADIAIFKPEEKLQEYPDFHGKPLGGNLHLSPRSTIKGGKIVYATAEVF